MDHWSSADGHCVVGVGSEGFPVPPAWSQE